MEPPTNTAQPEPTPVWTDIHPDPELERRQLLLVRLFYVAGMCWIVLAVWEFTRAWEIPGQLFLRYLLFRGSNAILWLTFGVATMRQSTLALSFGIAYGTLFSIIRVNQVVFGYASVSISLIFSICFLILPIATLRLEQRLNQP